MLPLRNQDRLTESLRQIYDRSSPEYRHFLSVEQFTQQFGATVEDYDGVINFAKSNGFIVTDTSPNRLLLSISGTVAQIEKAFHVVMKIYNHPTEGRTFYSPDREPSLDLAVPITHISGLNNFSIPHPLSRNGPAEHKVQNGAGTGPGGSFIGSDMRTAYYGGSSLTGSGQAVGLVAFSGFSLSDVQLYFAKVGQPLNVPVNAVALAGATTSGWTDPQRELEVVLDIDQSISMAPGLAQVRVYIAPGSGSDGAIFNKMATENLAKQLSCSWAWVPDHPTVNDPFFLEFAMQGQSLFVAAGDKGAYDGSPATDQGYPGEDANVTAVGGTQLTTNGSGGWQSEVVWNNIANGYAGGGGPSDDGIAIPIWQVPVINSSNGGSTTKRNVPDVAAEAAQDNFVCFDNGQCATNGGGTSYAAPRWAGFMALVNQMAATLGYPPLGFLNPTLYAIGQGLNYTNDFHDITVGNNSNGMGQSYAAVNGYDLATGWGSPSGQSLIGELSIGNLVTTITSLTSQAASVMLGSTVILTAAVEPSRGSGTPTGSIEFYDYFNNAAALLSTQTLPSSDIVTYNTTSLQVGTHSLSAIYNGDPNYFASISPILTVTVTPVVTAYSISGQVTYNGSGLAGVTITLSGGASGLATTNSAGNYTFGGLPGGVNYLVVPTLAGYTFNPGGNGFDPLISNQAANFVASLVPTTLTVSNSGSGTGTVTSSPAGISCGTDCSASFPNGTQVTLTASPSGGSIFAGWGGPCSGTAACILTMNSNQTVQATFDLSATQPVLSLTPGIIATAAGNGTAGYSGDGGPAVNAQLAGPEGPAVDTAGNVYFAGNNVIRKVTAATGIISTVAGDGVWGYNGDGGPAINAELYGPSGVALDASGNLYICEYQDGRIRVVNMQAGPISVAGVTIQPGNIATVAGNGIQGYAGDNGPAVNAELFFPSSVAVDTAGNIYIADFENAAVRMVSAGGSSPFVSTTPVSGYIYTIAGNGTPGGIGNGGPATSAELRGPSGVAIDGQGNLYIADTYNFRVQVVSAVTNASRTRDYIYTVAGVLGYQGYSGDGGLGIFADLKGPEGLAVDNAGNLYIADSGNNRIREVNATTGIITTVAGNGSAGYAGDNGAATSAELNLPYGVAVFPSTGELYIADSQNNRLRAINVQQSSLIFGYVNIGQSSAAQGVTVSNVGNEILDINQISASVGFSLNGIGTTCSVGTTLAPGASCILGIEFAPAQLGSATGSVTIADNAANSPQTVILSGTGDSSAHICRA